MCKITNTALNTRRTDDTSHYAKVINCMLKRAQQYTEALRQQGTAFVQWAHFSPSSLMMHDCILTGYECTYLDCCLASYRCTHLGCCIITCRRMYLGCCSCIIISMKYKCMHLVCKCSLAQQTVLSVAGTCTAKHGKPLLATQQHRLT